MTSRSRNAGGAESAQSGPEDAVLMAGVVAERKEAFETLYRRYHPRLVRFLQGMTRRPLLVEEILDDTMLVVWRRARTYDPAAKVSTWIFGIAYRQALKALRRTDEVLEYRSEEHDGEQPDADPGAALHRHQQRRQIDRALATLSADHRAVIEMTYYLGYSCRDIAQIMDCPVDTVKTRMFHARRHMRASLDMRCEEAL
jgi:RNA polymerase sigma factor (sigma-70 family)